MIQLILQRFGSRTDDGLATAHQCGNQVGEGLAGSCARLDNQFVAICDGFRDRFGHPPLSRSRHETGQQRFEWAFIAEEFGQSFHGPKITRLAKLSLNDFRGK